MSWHGVPIPYGDRADWLEKRRQGIGASDVAAILELSPYASPFTVWADKVRGAEKEVTEAMRFGKKLETVIESEFEETMGLFIGARELLIHHPAEPWAMATIDGLAFESPLDPGLWHEPDEGIEPLANVEFKTDGGFARWEVVPDHYRIQTQWQMWVEGLDQTLLACLHGGRRFEIYEEPADPVIQQKMIDKVSAWREKYLLDPFAEPPEVDAHPATTKIIGDLWDADEDESIELNHGMYADLQAFRVAKQKVKEAQAEEQRLKNRLAAHMQEATTATWGGKPVFTYKEQTVKEHVRAASTFRVLRTLEK